MSKQTVTPHPGAGYSLREEQLNSLTHGLGVVLALIATVVMVVATSFQGDPWSIVAVTVYGLTLISLFLASTLYHSARQPRWRQAFKMLDHCAIFLLIAGSYTPFLLVNMRSGSGWMLFAIIWGLAAVGITSKLVFGHRFKLIQVATYLLMGWLVVVASAELPEILNNTGLWLLVAGGLAYTGGVVFYLMNRIPMNHAIWHLFVLAGAGLHFFAVWFGVVNG
ncbi:MAG: hemolysin III family protein [Halomonadaceae bacterium]|nr:MAG: hemolysin III family protein [Halomonadaceae bacterium]